MYIRDFSGNEYAFQATITNDYELNGNQSLSATIHDTKVNNLFINDISELWTVSDQDEVAHKIVYVKKQGKGNSLTVDIKAIPVFFDEFNTSRIYEEYNEHMTADIAFLRIFSGTNFNFIIRGQFSAVQWEGFGAGEPRLETFKRALERYKAEFKIVGNTVYLDNLIGRDAQFMYRYKLNASNIAQEHDANSLYTYARGYGNYGDGEGGQDWQDAKLLREYTSPLAAILGQRDAPPIKNGNIKTNEQMDAQLKILVDESLKISVTATIHDLRKQGYALGQPEMGDRFFLADERIGLNDEVRVVNMSITRDWQGKVLDLSMVFGSESITKRHQSNMSTAVKNILDLLEGQIKLPFSVLDDAVKKATKALQDAQVELFFTENGILAVDKKNPNFVTLFNSAGVGVSDDGGATFRQAITGHGVSTDLLTAGSVHTDKIRIIGENDLFYWDQTGLRAINPNDTSKWVKLDSAGLYVKKGAITIERPDGVKLINDGLATFDFAVNPHDPPFMEGASKVNGVFYETWSYEWTSLNFYSYRHVGRYLKIDLAFKVDPGTTGWIRVRNRAGDTTLHQFSFTSPNEGYGDDATISIDLGKPTMALNSFYIQGSVSDQSGEKSSYVRVIRTWLEG